MRLHASGVCHSDYNAVDGTAVTRCPAVLGHEGAGVVAAAGEGAGVAPGTRVMLSWMPACGRCAECLRGLSHLCARAWAGMGHGGLLDGTPRLSRRGAPLYHYSFLSTFADHTVVPAACCIPFPDDVPFAVAALAGCAVATGTGAVWRTAGVRPGELVAVFGCGGVGMSAVLGAVAAGAREVIAVDVSRDKLDAALELGATAAVEWDGGAGSGSPPRQRAGRPRGAAAVDGADATAAAVREVTGGGVDYAFEATGRPEAARAAFLSTRPRGAAVLIGIPRADAVVTLPALDFPRMERRVLGSIYGSSLPSRDFPALLDHYRRGRLPLDRLVSRRMPLDAVDEAFVEMRGGSALRVVLDLEAT